MSTACPRVVCSHEPVAAPKSTPAPPWVNSTHAWMETLQWQWVVMCLWHGCYTLLPRHFPGWQHPTGWIWFSAWEFFFFLKEDGGGRKKKSVEFYIKKEGGKKRATQAQKDANRWQLARMTLPLVRWPVYRRQDPLQREQSSRTAPLHSPINWGDRQGDFASHHVRNKN